ncbi:hypothetical protein CRUP_000051, partial [Coryphaenoides rupestris]
LNKCRVVADLESIIRDKFDISQESIVNLFIDNCYVPHTESIYVVRDNDAVPLKANPTSGKKSQPCPSSSSADSSSDEAQGAPSTKVIRRPSAPKCVASDRNATQGGSQQGSLAPQPTTCTAKPASGVPPPASVGEAASGRPTGSGSDSDSDSEEEIKLVIKRPLLAGQGVGIAAEACMSARGRGSGRGQPRGMGRTNGGNPEGRVGREFNFNYDEDKRRRRPPAYEKDSLTNHSVMLQMLELTEDYTPEVSEYKVTERWDSLLEPRLVI